MESELIFGAESEASIFAGQHDQSADMAVQMAAVPQAGEAMPSPLLPHDAAKVEVAPGQDVVRVPVTPGEVVELPFGPDAELLGREANGNLAIKVGDVTVILQGFVDANQQAPIIVETSDGKPIDIATLLASTDPNINITTAAGPAGSQGGQGADNSGGIFQLLGGEGGLGGFTGAGAQGGTDGPGNGPGPDGGEINQFFTTAALLAVNNPATIAGDDLGKVKEDVVGTATGTLTVTDPDAGESHTQVATDVASDSGYGKFSVDADGHWIYTLDNSNPDVQALPEGGTLTDTFTVVSQDGTATETVTITINGTNDVPTITGDTDGKVTEDGTLTATGTLTVADVDTGESNAKPETDVTSDNGYGKYSVDADGKWTYTLDNTNTDVQALPDGGTLTDTFTITSKDGTATETVTITINGTNDVPTITGDTTGDVTEDGTLIAQGTLTVTDTDNGESHAMVETDVASDNGYGKFSVDADGKWTYTLDNTNTDVQALPDGDTLTDTFTVTSKDGTATETVTITINGTNDVPTITGDTTGKVTEDVTAQASGTLTVTDVDKDESHTQSVTDADSAKGYGTYSVDGDGHWTYTLDNTDPAVNALPAGAKLTDTFTVTSADGTKTETVTITIDGTNDKPTITGDNTGDVTEDVKLFDIGQLTVTDPDKGESAAQADINTTKFGGFIVLPDGEWAYLLDDTNLTVQGLHKGETLTDTFTVTSKDGTVSETVTITIHGTDDKAVIFGTTKGTVLEDSGKAATGTLTVLDLDKGDAHTQTATNAASKNGYGTFSVDADGHWTYTLDDTNATVNALPAGGKLTDTFAIKSFDGNTSQTITITINGANDKASISGDNTGNVTEDDPTKATGTLTVTDVDTGQAHTQIATNAGSVSGYGTYSVDADGHWNYTLDSSKATVQALGVNDTLTDTFTVKSTDGTASQLVTVTIHGANDKPVIDSNGGGDTAKISIAENTSTVTTVHAADPDKTDTLTYSISGTDAALFTIDKDTGALSFVTAPDFEHPGDKDGDNVYDVVVKADDSHGGTDTQAIAVTVTDVKEAANPANDYIFTTDIGQFGMPDSWLLANDTGDTAGLKVDSVSAGANANFFENAFLFIPTPADLAGTVYVNLDTTKDAPGDNSYLTDGQHTSFTYTASNGVGSGTATAEVTFINGSTIDRSGDTHGDIIVGADANDKLIGGSGNDFINGDDGNDLIFGGPGKDSLFGGTGNDIMVASGEDNAHGQLDGVLGIGGLGLGGVGLAGAGNRGDVLAFTESVNLTEAKYNGHFDGIETISLKQSDSNVAGAQTLTIGASNVQTISDHQITLTTVFAEHAAVKIDMDAVDQLYLSISKDGGTWADTGKHTTDGYEIFAHTAAGGGGEDAYVLVATPDISHVVVNKDAPTP